MLYLVTGWLQGLVIGLAVASAVAGTALLALFIVAARGLAKRRQQLSRVREYKVMAGLSELDPSQMDMAAGLGIGMLPKINRNASWKRSYVSTCVDMTVFTLPCTRLFI